MVKIDIIIDYPLILIHKHSKHTHIWTVTPDILFVTTGLDVEESCFGPK